MLAIEVEDLKRDEEEFLLRETRAIEETRWLEIARGHAIYEKDTQAAIRRQRVRWKVRTSRKHVVMRQEEAKKTQAMLAPTMKEAGSISFAIMQQRRMRAQRRAKEAAQKETRAKAREAKGSRNPHVIAAFDNIVQATHHMMHEISLPMRMPKTDIRENRMVMCWTCGHVQCTCAMNQKTAAESLMHEERGQPVLASKAKQFSKPQPLGRRRQHTHDAFDGRRR
jgi:hypothetical protein